LFVCILDVSGDGIGGVVTWSAFVYPSCFAVGLPSATEIAKLNPLNKPCSADATAGMGAYTLKSL
jgi:hypothetical protein